MKRIDRSYWSAWVLLLVFVPMVLLSSVHVHAELDGDAGVCSECLAHSVHKGHLTTLNAHVDCPLCALENNVYQAADDQQQPFTAIFTSLAQRGTVPALAPGATTHQRNRAPPFSFCV